MQQSKSGKVLKKAEAQNEIKSGLQNTPSAEFDKNLRVQQVNPGDKPSQGKAIKSANPEETGGPKGLEPTRYGDWEKSGRCIDF